MGKKEVKNHTKTEFEAIFAEKAGLTKVAAKQAVDAFIASVTDIVKKGDSVSFTGFGKFEVGYRAAREGRNPKTGEPMKIAASKSPKFSAGKLLKDAVNGK
ncbi:MULTISPECIES: HU family DNA-binding protein [Cysteiniphilum]|uniref:DNA-binding protein HU-beta n=1 Tax=Cysteiniphilum litorale TaxID=2056700 RepID=A0A8J3E870_9GAMM|nr:MULTISPECIES: HU family DNA-binding protein [Cysteiniphilum]GGF91629.1 DNA-binding protein HU-beta [Cysteiniphilum litorale]